MPPAPKLQPALFGGLFIGVLSALPIINLGNCLCCLWVVGGGALAVYLMQQNYPYAIQTADGALVGLLAGVIGGALCGLLVIPLALAFGPLYQGFVQRAQRTDARKPARPTGERGSPLGHDETVEVGQGSSHVRAHRASLAAPRGGGATASVEMIPHARPLVPR